MKHREAYEAFEQGDFFMHKKIFEVELSAARVSSC